MWAGEDACLKCTLCMSACPVMSVNADFPGPKALGPEWHRRRQEKDVLPMEHVEDCTFCQLCEAACPVAVPIAHLIAQHKQIRRRTLKIRIRDAVLARPHWLARTAGLSSLPIPEGARKLIGIASSVTLPQRRREPTEHLGPRLATGRGAVGVFVDCYSGGYDSELVFRVLALLDLWGYDARPLAGRGCCGAAAYAAGAPDLACRQGQLTWKSLRDDVANVDTIIILNATCDATIRYEWPRYCGIDGNIPMLSFDEVAWNAPEEFWEHLGSVPLGQGDRYLVHTTCRGKVARGEGYLVQLMARAGLSAVPSDADCCGAAGAYAFKAEHQATAHDLGYYLRGEADKVGAAGVVTDSGTCALHIEQLTQVVTRHPAHWLYERYRQYLREAIG